tara:strand:+ start:516 stop:1517 length:1002 start_codon:yes stop_codon:yes gene_type:complete
MKIAIVKLSALGDIIHTMFVLQFIKKYNHEILIDWVVEESYKDLLNTHPDINKVHVVNFKKAKQKKSLYLFFNEIKNVQKFGNYDLVIDMQGLIKSALISRLITSSITLGFDKKSAREGFASIFYNQTFTYGYEKNIVERNLEMINFGLNLNIKKQDVLKKLPFLYSSKKHCNNNLSKLKKNVLLIPGASNKSKRLPVSSFVKLSTQIDANFIIIWGSLDEKILANEIKRSSLNINISHKLNLEELILLIGRVDLVIGPDTGPTHMAWALNIPSITIYGPTPGYRNSYTTNINRVIESDSIVNPFRINHNDYSLKDLNISDIVETANNLLLSE